MGLGRKIVGLAAALLLTSTAAGAAPKDTGDLDQLVRRGEQIYALDRAAWVATDVLLEQLPDARTRGIGGWIVVEQPDGLRVIFYRPGPEPTSVFTADVRDNKVVATHLLTEGEDNRLSAAEVRMVTARQVAAAQDSQPCTNGPMNTVVIPPAGPDSPVEVYVMTAQVKAGEYPFGGHYRYGIGPKGDVVSSRRFTKGCLNLSTAPPEADATPAGLMLSHLLDPTPTEIHVFMARWSGVPVFVVTPNSLDEPSGDHTLWSVDGSSIRLIER